MQSRKSENIFIENGFVSLEERELRLGQRGFTIWLTGLSASGKSTLARGLERELFNLNYLTYVLDGDNLRHGINCNLGFSSEDRKENIRRTAELAKHLTSIGIINIVAMISPFREDRLRARKNIGENRFVEVFVKCAREICEQRDPKGLYKKAKSGEIKYLTGINSPYEIPDHPEVIVQTDTEMMAEGVKKVITFLGKNKYISAPLL